MFEILFAHGLFAQSRTLLAQAADDAAALDVPFYKTGLFVFAMLIAVIALGWYLGHVIANSLNVTDYGGRMAVVLVTLLLAGLMIGAKWPPKFGVDLRGGINMIGSLNLEALGNEDANEPLPEAKDIIPNLIQRVNPSGTKEIMIRALGTDKIEVTIPSVSLQEADEIWNLLVEAGKLDFRIVATAQENPDVFEFARSMAEQKSRKREVKNKSGKVVAKWTSIASEVPPQNDPTRLTAVKYLPQGNNLVRDKATGRVVPYQDFAGVYTGDIDVSRMNLAQWLRDNGIRTLQILMLEPDEDRQVGGTHLSSVSAGTDERGRGAVHFKTTDAGASLMGGFTGRNVEREMGIVLDDQLHSAPRINEAIYRNGQITGNFTPEEVQELKIKLDSGKLEVALNKAPISKDFIESTLGQELKEKGIWAITASLILVMVFMIFYYRFAGFVATFALLLNLVLIMALIMAISQPLTLTGLAGLVLTVGMSVDANVLIFERIREELDRGAALRMAIRNGFDKATTTIVDANVTTLITAIVLYVIGTEQIKGFSVTLILGILMSMFTAIFCSRLFFDVAERKRWLTKLNMARIWTASKFNFLNKVTLTGLVSSALIVAGIFSMYTLGSRLLSHDLRGGSTVRMVFNEPQDIDAIRTELDSLGHEHKGEKTEFTVSGFANDDPQEAGRVFKVDSSLPAWEGDASGEEKFEQLDELLSRVFKNRLQLHHVDIKGNNAGDQSSNRPVRSLQQNVIDKQMVDWRNAAWSALPSVAVHPAASSMLLIQDDGEDAATETEPDPASGESEVGSLDSVDLDAVPQQPAEESSANDTEEESGEETASAGTGREVSVTRSLKFDEAISGKTLQAMLVEASRVLGLDLQEAQVIVDSNDVQPDESALSTRSTEWDVTLAVQREGDADQIISEWASKFNQQPYFPTTSKVGGQIARKTQLQALAAIVASLIGIIAYIWIRFQNIAFGLAAVIALIHDVLIVLGAIALSHWLAGSLGFLGVTEFKISLEIVAALLTVIGYSLNDTIVVFDRIREVRGKRTEITSEMINTSISQTLSRTILTSLTTFIVVFILYWFGGDAIHGFAFALVIGVIVGTYSSIFVASPALLWLMNSVGLNPGVVDPAAE